ncbi:MAG: cell division protein SepF [Firmicutes bacterium]|nr:cell division protein SepF [Bacillota bacterium]
MGNREVETWDQSEPKKSLLERFMNLFGFESVEEEVEAVQLVETVARPEKGRGKVVSLAGQNKVTRLVVYEPTSFDDVQSIVNQLKNKRPVILNLEETEKGIARRITDFVGGAVYAIDGAVQKVSPSIVLFTPPNVEVTFPLRTEAKNDIFTTDKFDR